MGTLQLEESIFSTAQLDQALNTLLPHSLTNIIAASILDLVEENRIDAILHLCGAQLQPVVVTRKTRRSGQTHAASHKRPGGHMKTREGAMMPQSGLPGRMAMSSASGRSGRFPLLCCCTMLFLSAFSSDHTHRKLLFSARWGGACETPDK